MPEMRTVDIYPHTFDLVIADLSSALRTAPFETDFSVPLIVGGEARAAEVRCSIGEIRGVKSFDSYADEVPHEMRRTAAELLILNEVQHRVGLLVAVLLEKWEGLLDNFFGARLFYDRERGTLGVEEATIKALFDLSTPRAKLSHLIESDTFTTFEVLQFGLASPTWLRTRINRVRIKGSLALVLMGSPVGTVTIDVTRAAVVETVIAEAEPAAPIVVPSFDITKPLAVANTVINAVGLGKLFPHPTQREAFQQTLEDTMFKAMTAQAQEKNVTEMQTALKELGFYHGALDGRFGPETRTAIEGVALSAGLPPDIHHNDPQLIRVLSHAAARLIASRR